MKTTLLCAALAVSLSVCQAQTNLPQFQNFENGGPAGWTYVAAQLGDYRSNRPDASCPQSDGVISNPSVGSNGNNKTGFKTDTLRYVRSASVVTVTFNSYAYRGNQFNCDDQLFANICSASGQVLLYSVEGDELIGMSDTIPLNFTMAANNTIEAVVTATLPTFTEFYVLLDISFVDCNVNGAKRVVIDNVLITERAGGPLPVYFKAFSAVRQKYNVNLAWTTATEQNSRGFNVQRNSGTGWETIAFVNSKALNGNSSNDLSYNYVDVNSSKGITQYRIVQVDLYTSRQQISEVRSIKGEANGKNVVFPNPTSDGKTNLLFNDDKGARNVSLIDPSGRMIRQWLNVTTSSMQLTDLKAGFYYLKINNPSTGEQSMERIVVK